MKKVYRIGVSGQRSVTRSGKEFVFWDWRTGMRAKWGYQSQVVSDL
jgi:hypothetical protein